VVGPAVEESDFAVLAEAPGDAVDGVAVDLQGVGGVQRASPLQEVEDDEQAGLQAGAVAAAQGLEEGLLGGEGGPGGKRDGGGLPPRGVSPGVMLLLLGSPHSLPIPPLFNPPRVS